MYYNPFTSKTNWLQVAIIATAVLNSLVPFLSPEHQAVVTAVLGILAIITHSTGVVKFGNKVTDSNQV